MSSAQELRDAALKYHEDGHFVIPCRSGTKKPLIKWARNAKRLTKKEIMGFWDTKQAKPPDIAVRVDDKTLILDLDPQHHEGVKAAYPRLMAETKCAETPSGGLHAWFRIGLRVRPETYKGLDVLTRGRMALVPPSSGRTWVGRSEVASEREPKKLVQSVVREAGIEPAPEGGLARDALTTLEVIPYHRRNHTLTSIAGVLRSAGFRGNRLEAAIDGLVQHIVEQRADDPITPEDVARICDSIDWRNPSPFDTTDLTRYEFNTNDTPPPLRWLIQDFLPGEGVTSLFGMGKQGKSYIAMEILRCLATATPFLDMETPDTPSRVLYVDWEKRGASLKRRLYALAKDDKLQVTVLEPHGALVNMVEPLAAEVALGDYHLVIVDSLTIALMQGDVTEAATVVPALFALNSLGCPVFALDHTKKPVFGEPQESVSAFGSVFKGNVCSMNWRLKKVSGDAVSMNIVMQHINNNYDVDPADIYARIEFDFDPSGKLDRAQVARTDMGPTEDVIWRHLSLQTEPLTAKEIANALNLSMPHVHRTLSKLEEAHHVQPQKDDYWTALEQEDETDE